MWSRNELLVPTSFRRLRSVEHSQARCQSGAPENKIHTSESRLLVLTGMRFISLLLPVAVVIVPTVLHFFIKLLVLRVRVRHVKCTRMRFVLVVIPARYHKEHTEIEVMTGSSCNCRLYKCLQLHDLFSVRLERCIVAELCCGGQEVQQHNEHRGGRAVQRPVCI